MVITLLLMRMIMTIASYGMTSYPVQGTVGGVRTQYVQGKKKNSIVKSFNFEVI